MTVAYQYDASGYFAGMAEDHGLLPNNATYDEVEVISGFIPRWNGRSWEQIEDHKGKEGYLDGQPYTIKEYGPLPEGWSVKAPEPTGTEVCRQRIITILAELASIDASKVRPMAEINAGTATEQDHRILAELNGRSGELRDEMQTLEACIMNGAPG